MIRMVIWLLLIIKSHKIHQPDSQGRFSPGPAVGNAFHPFMNNCSTRLPIVFSGHQFQFIHMDKTVNDTMDYLSNVPGHLAQPAGDEPLFCGVKNLVSLKYCSIFVLQHFG